MTVTQDAGMPHITPISSGASITNSGYEYIIRVQLNDLKQAEAITNYMVDDLGMTRIACMYQNDDYGGGGNDVIKDVMASKGLELVADEAFEANSEDLSAQLSACLSAIGLTANTYFVMAAKQLVAQGRVPFELIVPRDVPTDETRAALVLAQAKELGLVQDDSPRFDTAEAAMAFLES